ncbi:MAG: hypothetical protein Rsou_0351 [Candidatus Ruthia sp. Asou_11_S2]|nr:hypothetical protein [Candidatus Ruthia sp. Asou_11_S2]
MTIRLTFSEMEEINLIAQESNSSKAQIVRSMIKKQLEPQKNLNQKILIEILMILRSDLQEDKHVKILKVVDEFKEQQGIK